MKIDDAISFIRAPIYDEVIARTEKIAFPNEVLAGRILADEVERLRQGWRLLCTCLLQRRLHEQTQATLESANRIREAVMAKIENYGGLPDGIDEGHPCEQLVETVLAKKESENKRLQAELTQWQAWGHRAGIGPAEIHYEEAEAAEAAEGK